VADRQLWEEDAAGNGWAPIHAAKLLGQRQATEAIPTLIEALHHLGDDDILASAAIVALSNMGAPAAEAAYSLHESTRSEFLRSAACTIIAKSGARDPRYEALLRALLDEDPSWGAACLAMYGDPSALEPLSEALARSNAAVANDIAVAIEALGGRLNEAQRATVALADRARGARQLWHEDDVDDEDDADDLDDLDDDLALDAVEQRVLSVIASRPQPVPKVGRNDPCPCGSNKTYKKCHGAP
jgi:hypothetical protein